MNNSLDLMRARLEYQGGIAQQDRMIKDKRKNLRNTILYSYQGAKVKKIDSIQEEFNLALINPNTIKQDYDDKIISIDYDCGYTTGTIFEWLNTGTKWLIYLQDLTELAYFKGDIRKCNYEIKWKAENKEFSTFAAIRGPVETKLDSTISNNIDINMPNHSINMLLPATEEVVQHFKRYTRFYIQPLKSGDSPICWRVEATDTISMPGVLELTAYEYYIDEQKDDVEKGIADTYVEPIPEPQDSDIVGNIFIKPKKEYTYQYSGDEEAEWSYDNRLPIEAKVNGKQITIKWKTTYTGQFVLSYGAKEKTIVVESLF